MHIVLLYVYNLDVLGASVCRCNYYEFIWYECMICLIWVGIVIISIGIVYEINGRL